MSSAAENNIVLGNKNVPLGRGLGRILPSLDAPRAMPEEALWEITLRPQDTQDATWRGTLLEQMRLAIEKKQGEDPGTALVQLKTALGTVEARLSRKPARMEAPLRLTFTAQELSPVAGQRNRSAEVPLSLPVLRLPDREASQLGARLVGLDEIKQDLLLRWACQWDNGLDAWSAQAGCAVPPALAACLGQSHALSIFAGDPGTGKTALARAVASEYCERLGIGGTLVSLTTEVRGEGLVGEFSQRLRAGFEQLRTLPESGLRVLLIDEADAVAIRRSEGQSHQEDRAATATVLQMLDALVGQRRLAILMTTNLASNIDAAIRRRAHLIAFPRPDRDARMRLLSPWLPDALRGDLEQAADAADGMTPADIEQTLLQAWLAAISRNAALTTADAVATLCSAARTEAV